MVIGFVGTGVMGSSMARRLLQHGYEVMVYTRTKEKAQPILSEGAEWGETIQDVTRSSDVVITMVGYPSDVEEVYFGSNGILESAEEGTYVIDMTTSKPKLAQQISEKAKEKKLYALDAPVSGGDIGAREGRLTIMVGGDKDAYEKMKPVFDILGTNVVLQGEAGAGQHTKMANQITIASNMIGVCEAIVYAQKAGLDPENVLKSIESGAAGSWSLSNLAPRMLKKDFEPGFYVKHFIKDMTIALEAAEEMNMMTPGLELSKSLYEKLAKEGDANSGTQALVKLYARDLY
ncbi:NAD(P)-dependent oxidoreductase [Alteribacillus iranensis]|uniref:3-hydroxyisobutyrate dehydrogenase n=1 Tax=Alteribacillus iranensis TaxID=930128 RepID=A0A1I2B4X8_9BACI|nr:NAD(P)-dependent oxidoreductase [Alteribacillus iranensis]SFE51221.1 3-hydroxyisobutyrate dehydrogenase [Alteribacillus iranensis]